MAYRLQIGDADALGLIDYPGKLGASGKRPRFHLTTRQTKLAGYLPEIQAALAAGGPNDGLAAPADPQRAIRGRPTGQVVWPSSRARVQPRCCNSSTESALRKSLR